MDQETKNLLQDAAHEIRALRRQNEILSAKVGVMEFFQCVLHTAPATRDQAMSPDVAWSIDKKLSEQPAQVPEPLVNEN